jgi:hypothetical protein
MATKIFSSSAASFFKKIPEVPEGRGLLLICHQAQRYQQITSFIQCYPGILDPVKMMLFG